MAVAQHRDAGRAAAAGEGPGVGRHLLADFWTDDAEALRWAADWEGLLVGACRAAGATVLAARFHQFRPCGVTGVVLLAESHASVHTWPERGLVTLDVFTCGSMDAQAVIEAVRAAVQPTRERVSALERGAPASRTPPGACV